jgi:hypothetical protein
MSGSTLYNHNKTVYLTFDTNSHCSVNINCPFPVKEIIIRNAQFQTQDNPNTNQFGVITSTLVNNGAVGLVATYNNGSASTPSPVGSIRYCYKNAVIINGSYDFFLQSFNNALWGCDGNQVAVVLIEFVSWISEITDTSA